MTITSNKKYDLMLLYKSNFNIMKKTIFILSSFFFINSCGLISINGSFQGLYSYYKNTKSKRPNLFIEYHDSATNNNLNNDNDSQIVLVTGPELRKCLSVFNNSVVYIWSPKCKSKFCPSLDILQEKCNRKKIELFIVAETFDVNMLSQKHKSVKTLFGINTKYYKTNLTFKYRMKFIKDIEKNQKKDVTYNRLFYFKKGKFIKSVHEIEDL